MSQCKESYTAHPDITPAEDPGNDDADDDGYNQCNTTNLGDGSQF